MHSDAATGVHTGAAYEEGLFAREPHVVCDDGPRLVRAARVGERAELRRDVAHVPLGVPVDAIRGGVCELRAQLGAMIAPELRAAHDDPLESSFATAS